MRQNMQIRFIRPITAIILMLIIAMVNPIVAYAAPVTTIVESGEVTEDGSIAGASAEVAAQITSSAAVVANALAGLQAQFPEGLTWTNDMKYVSTCTINGARYNYTGYGCVAFALMFQDITYGSTNASYTKTPACPVSAIEAGDIVRIPTSYGGHTYVILSVDATGATIAEGNYNSSIHWGRHVSTEELAGNTYVLSRNAA